MLNYLYLKSIKYLKRLRGIRGNDVAIYIPCTKYRRHLQSISGFSNVSLALTYGGDFRVEFACS